MVLKIKLEISDESKGLLGILLNFVAGFKCLSLEA